jgi:hypothetical protein
VDLGSYSSRVTVMMGAAIQAAEKLRHRLPKRLEQRVIPAFLFRRPGDSDAKNFFVKHRIRRSQIRHAWRRRLYSPPRAPGGTGRGRRAVANLLVFRLRAGSGSGPGTGWIAVPKIWIAHDIGRA